MKKSTSSLLTAQVALGVLSVATATGCGDIQYRPSTSHHEVIDITEKQVLSGQHVKLDQEGRLLHVQVKKHCDLVQDKEMEEVSVAKSDENVVLEAILMGLATAPITTGIVVLVDAQDVHDNDVNSRLFNSTGQSGARAAGIASVVLGTGMLVGSMVSLIRRTKPKVDERIYHEDGDVLAAGQRCSGPLRNARVQVQGILDNGAQVVLGTTNESGELTVDLGRQVPATHFATINPPLSLQLHIGEDMYGLVDLEPVASHHRRHRENIWANVDRASCDAERTHPACTSVTQFLQLFPNGLHSEEARALISNIGKPDAQKAKTHQVATSTCADKCHVKCEGSETCLDTCLNRVCK